MANIIERENILLNLAPEPREDAIRRCGEQLVKAGCVKPAYIGGMELEGRGVSAGLAVGTVRLVLHTIDRVEKRPGEPKTELARFEAARMAAAVQLGELAVTTAKKLGEENSLLFQIHQMMLEDLDYREAVRARIDDGVCAEYAVSETARSFAQDFASMDDAYMSFATMVPP